MPGFERVALHEEIDITSSEIPGIGVVSGTLDYAFAKVTGSTDMGSHPYMVF
jgi:hypothetical protein